MITYRIISLIAFGLIVGCVSNNNKLNSDNQSETQIPVDSNFWQPYEFVINDSVIDISMLNQLYYLGQDRVLVWDVMDDSIKFSGGFFDIQFWWVDLNDSMRFALSAKKHIHEFRLHEPYYDIYSLVKLDSTLINGFEPIDGKVIIKHKSIYQSVSDELIKRTEEKPKEAIYF